MSIFNIKPKKHNTPLLVIQLLFALFVFALVAKLAQLQIFDPDHLKDKARAMRQAKAFVYRGEIVDRNGIRLASDKTLYDIYAHPGYYEDPPEKIASELAPLLKKSNLDLYNKLKHLDYSTVTVAKDIDRDTILKLRKLEIKGLDIVRKNSRVYPQGNLASHILGYVNFDANIFAGVERIAQRRLETMPKMSPMETNGRGDIIYDFNTDPNMASTPQKGQKLVLTIDSVIQHIAETELSKVIKEKSADRGTVIVMNPKNGEILGFAVYPTYDPNQYKKANPQTIKNWVLSDVYPPGSTFKVLTVASALETGRISKYERVLDTGKIKIQGWTIQNYDIAKHPYPGDINLEYLFTHSSNVGSAKVALKMTPDEHHMMLQRFGIGQETGIDLPGESAGILPDASTWDKVRHATIGFGYSIAATPIQMAAAVSSIANKGVWITPHVIKYSPKDAAIKIKKRRVISPETASTMADVLERSIRNSAANAGKIPNFTVAGKTGTSRKPNPNGPGYLEGQLFTSIVGFFPSKDPQVLVMVVVDNAKGYDVWGSTVAGPIFNQVATQVTRQLRLKPDAPGLNTKPKKENE